MYTENILKSKKIINFISNELDNGNWLIKWTNDTLNLHSIPAPTWTHDKIRYHWKRIYPVYISSMKDYYPLLWVAIGWASYSLTHDNKLDYDWVKSYWKNEKTRLRNLLYMQQANIVQKIGKGSYYLNPSIMSNTDSIPKNINDLFKDNSTMCAD